MSVSLQPHQTGVRFRVRAVSAPTTRPARPHPAFGATRWSWPRPWLIVVELTAFTTGRLCGGQNPGLAICGQKCWPPSPIGVLSREEFSFAELMPAGSEPTASGRSEGMFLESAPLGLMFFIWTLRPHITKEKSTSFKGRDEIVVTALGINRA